MSTHTTGTNENDAIPKKFSWEFPANKVYVRSKFWYMIASLVMLGLLVYALVSDNFLFAIILVIFTITFLLHDRSQATMSKIFISHQGVNLNNQLIPFKDLDRFWLIYEPSRTKNIYFEFKNGFRPRLSLPLENQNPVLLREFLLTYLEEDLDREAEPLSDQLSRLLKI